MKTFLTLLAAITSLSAYTLVGVHALCPICPNTMNDVGLYNHCTLNGISQNRYKTPEGFVLSCSYGVRAR
ncbi:hypothetical protein PAXINDRAFT_172082 [Paxillus involutus ATCC 200175]|uniref:Uncharacterized protein n=1 Tax=Paxillus involutus ATCC 200175 TaxID=664439 RepID=A0A0C9T4Y5_PAXIN|nr:hypothetical protein PAXINDRAFT_172082 [Paxillus involutus ATCC 200175]